jgi:hypothetical protein
VGVPVVDAFGLELIVYALCFAVLAVVSNLRLLWATAALCAGALVNAGLGDARLKVVGASVFVAFLIMAWAWRDRPRE